MAVVSKNVLSTFTAGLVPWPWQLPQAWPSDTAENPASQGYEQQGSGVTLQA